MCRSWHRVSDKQKQGLLVNESRGAGSEVPKLSWLRTGLVPDQWDRCESLQLGDTCIYIYSGMLGVMWGRDMKAKRDQVIAAVGKE